MAFMLYVTTTVNNNVVKYRQQCQLLKNSIFEKIEKSGDFFMVKMAIFAIPGRVFVPAPGQSEKVDFGLRPLLRPFLKNCPDR